MSLQTKNISSGPTHWSGHAIVLLLLIGYGAQQLLNFEDIGLLADRSPFSQLLRLLTYPFFHGNLVHLGINALLILNFAGVVTNDLRLEGVARANVFTLLIFFVSVISGGICYAYFGSLGLPLVGASAGTYGLISFHCFGLLPWQDFKFFGLFKIPRFFIPFACLALELITYRYSAIKIGIAAHLGGILAGMVSAWIIKEIVYREIKRRSNTS